MRRKPTETTIKLSETVVDNKAAGEKEAAEAGCEEIVVEGEEVDEEEEEQEPVHALSTRRYHNFATMKRKLLNKSRWEPAFRDCVPL